MKYKLIVADFDDTILNSDLEYSPTLKDTIKRYVKAGGHFHIATGRMTSSILKYARELELKGELLSYQGSVATDIETGETLKTFSIPYTIAAEVLQYIEKKDLYTHIYRDNMLYLKEHTLFSQIYQNYCGCDAVELHYALSKYVTDEQFSPVKMVVMAEPEKVDALLQEFSAKFGDKLLFNTSKDCMVEIIPIDINKGIAVAWLAQRLGIKQDETVCIGDSLNDETMLKWAGIGAVVQNGSAAAKAVADVIVPSCDDKGVEYVIRKYGLEEDV